MEAFRAEVEALRAEKRPAPRARWTTLRAPRSPRRRPAAETGSDATTTGSPASRRREVLVDRLEHCMLRSARTAEQYAVLYCDLDGFKLVNDVFGHEAGDAVLAEVADAAARSRAPVRHRRRASAATSS